MLKKKNSEKRTELEKGIKREDNIINDVKNKKKYNQLKI